MADSHRIGSRWRPPWCDSWLRPALRLPVPRRDMTVAQSMNEQNVITEADRRAAAYAADTETRRAWPDAAALAATTGPRYFGYVVGGVLPAAAAAERRVLAGDQRASRFDSSPIAATIERVAGRWVLEALDLPRDSAVGFGTSAAACTVACLATARRAVLAPTGFRIAVACGPYAGAGAPTVGPAGCSSRRSATPAGSTAGASSLYITGVTSRASTVDDTSPPMITHASGE